MKVWGIFIVTPTLEGWPTKAKEARSSHEVRLALLNTNPVFQSLRDDPENLVLIFNKLVVDCINTQILLTLIWMSVGGGG